MNSAPLALSASLRHNAFHPTPEKIVKILLEAGGANQIQARECAAKQGRNREYAKTKCADRDRFCRSIEGLLMKKIPHTLGNLQQKETKLMKLFWRAELCDAAQVHHTGVTGLQELAPPFASRTLVSFVVFCFTLICLAFVCATSFSQTQDKVAER